MGEVGRIPASGLWGGWSRLVSLSRQGTCGERRAQREEGLQAVWAVLFFDEDSVVGHASVDGGALKLAGWWGPSQHLLPAVSDLAETELWSTGVLGLQLTVGAGRPADICFGWSDGEDIRGYRRREGG